MTWLFLVRDHGDYSVLSEVPRYAHSVQFMQNSVTQSLVPVLGW